MHALISGDIGQHERGLAVSITEANEPKPVEGPDSDIASCMSPNVYASIPLARFRRTSRQPVSHSSPHDD